MDVQLVVYHWDLHRLAHRARHYALGGVRVVCNQVTTCKVFMIFYVSGAPVHSQNSLRVCVSWRSVGTVPLVQS